jgi:hypothetical protein
MRGEGECVEGGRGLRIPVPGSSVRCDATPKDDGREGAHSYHKERNVKAKDSLFVLDCFLATLLAMTLAEGERVYRKGRVCAC